MRPFILLSLLAGCAASTSVDPDPNPLGPSPPVEGRTPIPSMGGQSGSEDILVCIEAERTSISDPSVIPTGASVAADVHLATLAERWQGVLDSGDAVEVTFVADTVAFVVYADEDWEPGDAVPYGVDDGCEDRYEIDVELDVDGGPLLDELVSTEAFGSAVDHWMRVYAGLWDEDVTGTTLPQSFDLATAADPWLFLRFDRTTTEQALAVDWVDDLPETDTDVPIFDPVTRTELTAAP